MDFPIDVVIYDSANKIFALCMTANKISSFGHQLKTPPKP